MLRASISYCYLLIEAIWIETTLKVGITLPQAGQQAKRENLIHMAEL
jgi:hypothetical protein